MAAHLSPFVGITIHRHRAVRHLDIVTANDHRNSTGATRLTLAVSAVTGIAS